MTTRDYTANVISATKVVPDGNFKTSKASGVWDINEALDLIKGGNWPNAANLSPGTFVDGLFSTFLYEGTGSDNLEINNGINLSGKGGLVWAKSRDNANPHWLVDTERGLNKSIQSNTTATEATGSDQILSFDSDGFTLGNRNEGQNGSGLSHVAWTFRKQPKFFDIVAYDGTGSARTISHNLGSVPGMIMIKHLNGSSDWHVYHRSTDSSAPEDYILHLNTNDARSDETIFNDTAPTSSVFSVNDDIKVNGGGGNKYVAYLFAHHNDDGGFGEPGDQDIIKCDTFTNSGSTVSVNLGFEPQLFMFKNASSTGSWFVADSTRGMYVGDTDRYLAWSGSGAEANLAAWTPTSTGVDIDGSVLGNGDYIYMAIRRGGMQTPSTPSTVFNIGTVQTDTNRTLTNSLTGKLSPDFVLYRTTGDGANWFAQTRLMGNDTLFPNTDSVANTSSYGNSWGKEMHNVAADGTTSTGTSSFGWMWARARGYFDVVAYTGTGSATTVNHNLGATPEMIWVKSRETVLNATDWWVFHKNLSTPADDSLRLNSDGAENTGNGALLWNSTMPTSSVFSLGTYTSVNQSGKNFIAYLFATVAGVTKLGSYTGNDGTTNVDCGFTNGARFVLIKKMNGTGDWVVLDSERGIVDGNTPYLRLNTTDAQDNLGARDIIDPLASGFTINANMGGVNDNGDTFLFYAIAADPS